ncbi:MAG TPA: hypothetical protein VEH81_01290 [Ktedonobacteraceae bacterium]|nr:hypothetical protein [Ktedonobacteraceae bacterium]
MRIKLLPLIILLMLVIVACGSGQSQKQSSTQAVVNAPVCQSTLPMESSPLVNTSSRVAASQHMNMGPHMKMTAYQPITPADITRMKAIVQNAHVCFDKYQDYQLALHDGYQIFAPNVPQDIYHFANVQSFVEAQTRFDLAHPSALLYQKVANGYQFVGVMYSAPVNVTAVQLNQRIPISIAPWHLHVNFCLPAGDEEQTLFPANSLFGLTGTISTQAQCAKVGGSFYASMYGWMVHIPLFGSVGIG